MTFSETKSLPLDGAISLVTGEAEFIDDRRPLQGEVQVGLYLSTRAHAHIKKIDWAEAHKVPGVLGIYKAEDFSDLHWGTIFRDQPLLAQAKVHYYGEPLLIIAAQDQESFRLAQQKIYIEYEELEPIFTIGEAKRKESYIGPYRKIERGEAQRVIKESPLKLHGTFKNKGQDHFYLESQAAIAYPEEGGRLVIYSSSQHPTEVQHVVAHALGLKYQDVTCVVKRMGGGFGGKESQAAPFAAYAALVAQKLKRPARLVLTKDEDMMITGKRHGFENDYCVAFDSSGKILALEIHLYSDGGAYADLSTSIMERAMLHIDNAYYIPHVSIHGRVCRTHLCSNTAFRGFGGPQAVICIESIIEDIAQFLNKDALEVRKLNVYQEGEETPYGQKISDHILPELFEKLEEQCSYQKRRIQIAESNKKSPIYLRGLSLTAVKFGISFTTRFLNQGNALVNVQTDGSIQVSTGATEMGQGVNTKIAQVVAQCFGLDPSFVRVMPTSTEKNHNTSPTAASSGTDINAMAALMASERIRHRLAPLAQKMLEGFRSSFTQEFHAEENRAVSDIEFDKGFVFSKMFPGKKISFKELVSEAYLNRVQLGDYAFYRTPGIEFDKDKGKGTPFYYYTNGVAASEVQVDKLTGEVKVLRVDILMDLGRPINEGIDLGQVSGAFVQGMGWVTTENLVLGSEGKVLTHSPTTYKIPNIQDIPREFNIKLLEARPNPVNVRGSKAVGEPPLLLAASVFTAVKNALSYERLDSSKMQVPATNEEILKVIYGPF